MRLLTVVSIVWMTLHVPLSVSAADEPPVHHVTQDEPFIWDLYGGDLPKHEIAVRVFGVGAGLGMSYAYRLATHVSVGARVGYTFPYQNAQPGNFFSLEGPQLGIPVRIGLWQAERAGLSLRVEPGLAWNTQQTIGTTQAMPWVLQGAASLSLACWLVPGWFSLGVATDGLLLWGIGSTRVTGSLVAGPVMQVNVTEHVGFFGDFKVGAYFHPFRTTQPTYLFSAGLTAGF